MGKKANFRILFKFAIPAAIMAILGALSLNLLQHLPALWSFSWRGHTFTETPVKLVIAFLMGLFAFLELSPRFKNLSFPPSYIPIGGLLSGFFGGLSGHQGALRSAFLIRVGLDKEAYIATTILASLFVDIPRLTICGFTFYGKDLILMFHHHQIGLIITAIASALVGSILGLRLLKKTTLQTVKRMVGILLIIYALALGSGLI